MKLLDDYKKKEVEIIKLKNNVTNFDNYKTEIEKLNDIKLKMQKHELAKEIQAKKRILDKLNEIQKEMSPDGFDLENSMILNQGDLEEEMHFLKEK